MKYLLFIISLFITNIATAQLSVHTGLTAGQSYHTFTVDGQQDVLQPGIGEEITYGIPIRLAVGSWSFQTGIFSNNLTRAFYFETPDGSEYGSKRDDQRSISSLKIPFIFSKEFKVVNRVSLAPKAGFAWLTNRTESDNTETISGTINEPDFQVIESVSSIVNKNKFLAEAGVDLNIYPFRHFMLTAGVTYSYGLQPIEDTNITYILGEEEITETLVSGGSGLNFHLGLKVPLAIIHEGHHRDLFK